MGGGKRRFHRFLCFRVGAGAVVGDDEETEQGGDRSGDNINCRSSRRSRRRRLLSRVFSRFLHSQSAEDGSQKQLDIRRQSSESSLPEKSFPGSFRRSPKDDDSHISEPIFSSSVSSSSTSSSLSSASSLVSSVSTSPIMVPETPIIHRRKLPTSTSRKFVSSPSRPSRQKYNPTTGLCILLVSLSVLVFSGKLCAILWTSTCLCLTPRRIGRRKPLGGVSPEVRRMGSLEGDKKRIVLEGFLERNRKV